MSQLYRTITICPNDWIMPPAQSVLYAEATMLSSSRLLAYKTPKISAVEKHF